MTQRRVSLEIKVGAFIITGVILLMVFLFAIGDLTAYFQPAYSFRVRFDSANGLGRGSPVQYSGVEVGKVADLQLRDTPEPHVEMIVRVREGVKVRTGDLAAISTFGLLGEKYLEITPGPIDQPMIAANGVLQGKPPVSTDMVIERSNEVLTELKQTLIGLNNLVGDPAARVYLTETLQEARDATRNWRVFSERMNQVITHVQSGEGNLGKIMYDETLHQEILAFVRDLREHPWKLFVRQKSGHDKDSSEKKGR